MITLKYSTAKGYEYPLQMQYKLVDTNLLSFDPETVSELCRTGCRNYGVSGGCPPRAPLFPTMVKDKEQVLLIICKFDSRYKPVKVQNSNNIAVHWKFQDGILARTLNRLGHQLTLDFGGSFLATGYCMGCPGKKCSFKLGMTQCRNPQLRTYSMEATGVNVVETVKNIFGDTMYWYKKGIFDIPYMLKCITFIPEQSISKNDLDEIIQRSLFSLNSIKI